MSRVKSGAPPFQAWPLTLEAISWSTCLTLQGNLSRLNVWETSPNGVRSKVQALNCREGESRFCISDTGWFVKARVSFHTWHNCFPSRQTGARRCKDASGIVCKQIGVSWFYVQTTVSLNPNGKGQPKEFKHLNILRIRFFFGFLLKPPLQWRAVCIPALLLTCFKSPDVLHRL